jgi:hypothetical protein
MKHLRTTVYLLCIVCVLTGCALQAAGAAGTSGPKPVTLEALLEAPETVSGGSSVKLAFTLTNQSPAELYVLTWYTPLEGIAGEIFDVSLDGQSVPYGGLLASRAVPTAENYVLLGPEKSATAIVDLATAYDFSQPGVYTVAFRSPRISHLAQSTDLMADSMDDLGPVEVTSNEVVIEIED